MSSGGQSASDGGTLNLTVAAGGSASVQFTSTSTPGSASIASYAWTSNGSPMCSTATCSFPFSTPSNTIALTVTDASGKSSVAQGTVLVTQQQQTGPAAHFAMSSGGQSASDGGTLNLTVAAGSSATVQFTSTSTPGSASIASYSWTSNGSPMCSTATCSFPFSTPSNTIALTVTDSNGKTSTVQGTVLVTQQQQTGPAAHFAMSSGGQSASDGGTLNLTVAAGSSATVQFTSTSTPGSASIASYEWTSNGSPICATASCTYAFSTPSNTIALTVTDTNGKTSTVQGTVLVTQQQQQAGPAAHFTMSSGGQSASDGGTLNLTVAAGSSATVQFTSTSTPGSASITSYAWTSNGSPICATASCTYAFSTPSNTIALTVTDTNGKTSTVQGTVLVAQQQQQTGPAAHFTMSSGGQSASDGGTLNLTVAAGSSATVQFTSTSTPGSASITSYAWTSNGSPICATASCTYAFSTPSNTIALTVTDTNGKTSTVQGTVLVTQQQQQTGPAAHFTMSSGGQTASDGGTLNLTVQANGNATVVFQSTSTPGSATITSYVWKSNGTSFCTNSASCSAPFGTASNAITLTVTDANGKTATAQAQLNITIQNGLSFTSLTPSSVSTAVTNYQPSLSAAGYNFNNVNSISWSSTDPAVSPFSWTLGDTNWNQKVTVTSNSAMTLRPIVTVAATKAGTYTWTVTLTDTSGTTKSQTFTVQFQ